MRPIKFRGKATMPIDELNEMEFEHDNGWVVGNLIQNGGYPFIVGDFIEVDEECTVHEFWCPVHPESVGQYTGVSDQNGTEIFEGDIIRGYDGDVFYDKVYFDEERLIFMRHEDIELWENVDRLVVVGNTRDNPELLDMRSDEE